MSGIEGTASATPAAGALPPPVGQPAPNGTLLPPPSELDVEDAIAAVMKLSSQMNEAQSKAARENLDRVKHMKEVVTEKYMEALDRAIAAAAEAAKQKEDEGGFFSDVIGEVMDNLGPLALVGFAVGGVFMVAADFLAHEVGLEDGQMDLADAGAMGCMLAGPIGFAVYAAEQCIKKFGPDEIKDTLNAGPTIKDDDVRKANRIAFMLAQAQLAFAATLASGGTAAPSVVAIFGIGLSTATQLAQETGALQEVFGDDAKWVALGGTLTGAALSLGGTVGCMASAGSTAEAFVRVATDKNLMRAAETAQAIVTVAHSASNISEGIEALEIADLQHEADTLHIEAKKHKQVIEFFNRMIDDVIEDVRSLQQSAAKSSETCKAMMDARGQALQIAATSYLKG